MCLYLTFVMLPKQYHDNKPKCNQQVTHTGMFLYLAFAMLLKQYGDNKPECNQQVTHTGMYTTWWQASKESQLILNTAQHRHATQLGCGSTLSMSRLTSGDESKQASKHSFIH